jgi:hypothetical protein
MGSHLTPLRRSARATALVVAITGLLSGCEYLGVDTPATEKVKLVAEGKAIGGACRHANRALEDCYRYNPKAVKAAVFEGWKDMDVYMRENKLDTIVPVTPAELPKPKAPPKPPATDEKKADEEEVVKTDKKAAKH